MLRDRAILVRATDDGLLENSYNLKLINTSEQAQRFKIQVEGLPSLRLDKPGQVVEVAPTRTETVTVRVQAEPEHATRGARHLFRGQLAEP